MNSLVYAPKKPTFLRSFALLFVVQSLSRVSLWPHGLQHTRVPCPSPSPGACSNWCIESVMPSNHLILCLPLLQYQGLFQWVSLLHQVAKVFELQLQHQSFQWIFKVYFPQDWLVWSHCCPRDSQESYLAPQFESINSSALGLLDDPTLTSIHDYWKNHNFDCMDLCQQGDVSAFNPLYGFIIAFFPRIKHLLSLWL